MKITENLGLQKPDATDTFDIETFNTNMDLLDEHGWQLAHPVGTYVITSTRTNPATIFGGGTWELRHKYFKRLYAYKSDGTLPSGVTMNTTNVTSVNNCLIEREGNHVRLRFVFENKVALLDTTTALFTLDYDVLGITGTGWTKYFLGYTDGGEGIFMSYVGTSGNVGVYDVTTNAGGGASVPAGNTCYFDIEWTLVQSEMLDSACDEFHWLRTA